MIVITEAMFNEFSMDCLQKSVQLLTFCCFRNVSVDGSEIQLKSWLPENPAMWNTSALWGFSQNQVSPTKWTKKKRMAFPSHLFFTLPETNVAPKNGWLEDYFPIGEAYFQGLC